MRIENLKIENFRAKKVWIDTRSTMIVIAGPNGCGKSCVLDGIRFIKSAYGGYGPNEWDQWLGEFQIGSSGFRVDEVAGGRGVWGSKATLECVTRTCTRGFWTSRRPGELPTWS